MTKKMHKNELGTLANDTIAAAIAEGFSPSIGEIRALYGNCDWYFVMAKGDERIVLYSNSEKMTRRFDAPEYDIRRFEVKSSRFNLGGKKMDRCFDGPRKWDEYAETIATMYAMDGSWDGEWFTDDLDEAIAAKNLRSERFRSRHVSRCYESMEVNDALLAVAKRHDGFKTVTSETLRVKRLRNEEGISWCFSRTKNGKVTNSFYVKTAA